MDNNQNNFNENNGNGINGDNLFSDVNKNTFGFSVASLVLGIISIVCCCLPYYLPLAISVLAIVFAILHRNYSGSFNGMAIAGLVCGIVGFTIGVTDLLVSIFFSTQLEEWAKQYSDLYSYMA